MSIKELTSRHEAIMQALVIEGRTPRDICQEFGFTESRLSILRSSPLWKESEGRLRQELKSEKVQKALSRMESLTENAVDALEDCVNDESDNRLRLLSAKEILDRVGVGSALSNQATFTPSINLYIPPNWNNKE